MAKTASSRGRKQDFRLADEDLEREDRDKTSAVHFLRFPINEEMVEEMRSGARIMMGVNHPSCQIQPIPCRKDVSIVVWT